MANECGSSSPSTKRTDSLCPVCGKGTMRLVTKDQEYQGVRVFDLLVDECDSCGECLWSPEETRRLKTVVETKQRLKAA